MSDIAVCHAASLTGIDAVAVDVEVDIGRGLPGLKLVGLPAASVKESEERVKAAVRQSGFAWPTRRVTVNLAPADLKKEGSAFDLPIALAILAATEAIPRAALADWMALGELSLDGRLRPVRGALSYAVLARKQGIKKLLLAAENAAEAALCDDMQVFAASDLTAAASILTSDRAVPVTPAETVLYRPDLDFADVRGQDAAKRAALVAAAGGHNLLMIGPPGSGKTMIARRIPTVLPELAFDAALEVLRIHSVAGLTVDGQLSASPPFRSPHHTTSTAGMIGGGSPPRPGEVSLAHRGILFLDELPEFRRDLLESLRQPLEDGTVTVTRARASVEFPARIMLVAAMNPCPCGQAGSDVRCRCAAGEVERYRQRLSGPLLDRIDIQIEVPRRPYQETQRTPAGEDSEAMRQRVTAARNRQERRYASASSKTVRVRLNAAVPPKLLKEKVDLAPAAEKLLAQAVDGLGLSARAADKILRVAFTVADLAGRDKVIEADIAEAVSYRVLDKRYR